MLPILITIGQFSIYSFGFFSALAFLAGSFLFWRSLKNELPEEELLITSLLIGIGATLGARVIPALSAFFIRPTIDVLIRAFLSGNLSFWGALLGGLLPLYLWQRRRVSQPWDLVDPLGTNFLVIATIVAIGSHLAGSWWGRQSSFLKAVGGIHPVSLYLSAWCFLGIILARIIRRQYRSWTWYRSGKVGLVGLFCLGWFFLGFLLIATLVEKQIYWGPLAIDQFLSLLVLVFIIILVGQRADRSFKELITWLLRKRHQ